MSDYEQRLAKINEKLNKEKEKTRQLENQKRVLESREKEARRKLDTRQKIIAGGILLDVFPKYKRLQPQRNQTDNNKEFAPLAHFLLALAGIMNLWRSLKRRHKEHRRK